MEGIAIACCVLARTCTGRCAICLLSFGRALWSIDRRPSCRRVIYHCYFDWPFDCHCLQNVLHILSTSPPLAITGGQVKISRKGVPRVVWERKKTSDDPDKPPTVDLIPFLSVSRSLGDFWSWCERTQKFVVSPHPDVDIHALDPTCQKFLVLASDGLWNVMSPQDVVNFIWEYKTTPADEEEKVSTSRDVVRALIDEALYRWRKKGMFADNISVVIAFLTQEGTEDRALESLLRCQDSRAKTRPEREEESQQRVEERLPVKRSRETEGETSFLTRPPLQKKSRQERDSGCESDSGSPVAESEGSLVPGPSSGTFPQTVEPCSSSPIFVSSPLPA